MGAGASFWCGYPLGDVLVKQIISDMNDKVYIPVPKKHYQRPEAHKNDDMLDWIHNNESFRNEAELFLKQSYLYQNEGINHNNNYVREVQILDMPQFQSLEKALKERPSISIDAFLRDNPSFQKAVKTMIVYSLLKKENKKVFECQYAKEDVPRDNWYVYLVNHLTTECSRPENILENRLKIITLNYDVSLDSYLINSLLKKEKFSAIAKDFLEKTLEIVHVYGNVSQDAGGIGYGNFYEAEGSSSGPWFMSLDNKRLNEKNVRSTVRFLKSLDLYGNIKTMYEERNGETREEQIEDNRKILREAKILLSLGLVLMMTIWFS